MQISKFGPWNIIVTAIISCMFYQDKGIDDKGSNDKVQNSKPYKRRIITNR